MATLVENATRITEALADIKQAIIDKGVTPTGKCETFADAIEQISGGDSDFIFVYHIGDESIKNIDGIEFLTNAVTFTSDGISIASGGSGRGFYSKSPVDTSKYKALWVELKTNADGQIGTITTAGSLPTAQTSGANRKSYVQTTTYINKVALENGYGLYFSNRNNSAMTITRIWIEKASDTPTTLSLDEGGEE